MTNAHGRASDGLRRVIDVAAAMTALGLFSWLFLLVALLVASRLGRPIFFTQMRSGKDGKPFRMIKFRTMTSARGPDGEFLPDKERLTPFGRFLRASSLDEIPEFWNVLRGDMSLVGPRPLLLEYLPRYNTVQRRRLEVRPGLTGWAQINGRNAISWPERFALDIWYVDNRSFWLDLKIIALTGLKVFQRGSINASDDVTMPLFKGNKGD